MGFSEAQLALEGLSVGDAFGQAFFIETSRAEQMIATRQLPPPPWYVTDDTIMSGKCGGVPHRPSRNQSR